MADSVTGNIIAKTHQGLVPATSDNDKLWARDQAIGEWVCVNVTDTANATVGPVPVYRFPYAATIKDAYVISQNTIAASGTEYKTYTGELLTAGVARTCFSKDTQAANLNGLVALVPKQLALSSTQANNEALAGDVFSITLTDSAGSTSTLGQGCFFLLLERKYA